MRVPRLLARAAALAAALAPAVAHAQPGGSIVKPAAEPAPDPKKPVLAPPVLQQFVEADYPADARKANLEGTVVLQLDIDAEGKVTGVTVLNPAGHGFDEAATEAAKKFRFQPALRDGKAVASRIAYRYAFTLKVAPPPADGPPPPKAPSTILHGVIDISGTREHLTGARVGLRGPNGATYDVTTAADGSFTLTDVPPGKYSVSVTAAGFEGLKVEEEIELGKATEVVYRLRVAGGEGNEILVRGERPPREVTKRTIEQRELSRIPGTNGDALRAVQNMPGVARPPGLAGLLIVRGSAPQDTQVFVDGTLIPLVYHFGGLTSVVPTELIEKLDFYPGNFSSQYGRVMGGIVDVGVRTPKNDGKYHALAQADFIDARVAAEGPIPLLKGWTFIAGARRSYVDVWLKPVLESTGSGVTSAPVYYDYQAFVQTEPTSKSKVRIGFFGSDDKLEILIKSPLPEDPVVGGDIGIHTSFWRLQASYKHELTDNLRISTVLAYGQDKISFNLGSLYFNLTTHPLSNRLELSHRIAKGVTVNVGQDILYNPFDISLRAPQPPRPGEPDPGPFAARPPQTLNESDVQYRPGAYVETEIVPHERARIVAGFRADYSKDTKKWDASPRLNGRFVLLEGFPKTTLKGGIGVFHQPPTPQETAPVFGSPGLSSNRAIHYSTGAEQELSRHVDVSVEGFYKQLDSLVARAPGVDGGFAYHNRGSGYVVGAEVLLRYKPDARFFGWLAYTLSRSMRRSDPSQELQLFQYDQTHILTMLGSYRLGRGWEFGARFRMISGPLETPSVGGIFNSSAGTYGSVDGAPFSTRLSMFHQLDLRLDKHWDYEGGWRLSTYLDILNVYNRRNAEALSYNYNYTQSTTQSGLPFIPSVGVRAEF